MADEGDDNLSSIIPAINDLYTQIEELQAKIGEREGRGGDGPVIDYETYLNEHLNAARQDIDEIEKKLKDIWPPREDDADEGGGCRTESPEIVGTSGEGDESPDTGTWPTANGDPLILYLMSRGGYFDAGAQTFYGYSRAVGVDGCGKILYVSAESRYPIFTTEDCTDSPAFGF